VNNYRKSLLITTYDACVSSGYFLPYQDLMKPPV
jgi:hypothetical protein